jgi:hypothetical protein
MIEQRNSFINLDFSGTIPLSIDFEFTGFIHFNQNRKVGEESNENANEMTFI